MIKFGIGVITCERFGYLRKCIESLYHFNPELKEFPLIIGDDASGDTINSRIREFWPLAFIPTFKQRAGCSRNIKVVFDYAEKVLKLNYLFFTVNDFACTRKIDFKALIEFMEKTPEAGQIQFVYWKGIHGDIRLRRAQFNWTTREGIKTKSPIKVGNETLIEGNWSYVNLPAITRLNVCDITKGTIGLEGSGDKFHQSVELKWVKNWYNTGLKNYQTDWNNQPFIGLDFGGNRTKGLKV